MRVYEDDDIITCYFVVHDEGDTKIIRGWSDEKEYAQLYFDFHKHKKYKIKKMTDTSREVIKVIEENTNDEINLYNISTRNPKKNGKSKMITVPLTYTEFVLLNEEINSFMASRINYGYISQAYDYLKPKYQKALKGIFLKDVFDKVVYEKQSRFVTEVEVDELLVLFRSLPDHFGE